MSEKTGQFVPQFDKEAVVSGDQEAFEVLYQQLYHELYNSIFSRWIHHEQTAEDITQDTFFRLYRRIHNPELKTLTPDYLRAYIYRIAYNISVNFINRRQLPPGSVEIDAHEDIDFAFFGYHVEDSTTTVENKMLLTLLLEPLTADQRLLVLLKSSTNMTNRDLGELFDRSEQAMKSWYFRTLRLMEDYAYVHNLEY